MHGLVLVGPIWPLVYSISQTAMLYLSIYIPLKMLFVYTQSGGSCHRGELDYLYNDQAHWGGSRRFR